MDPNEFSVYKMIVRTTKEDSAFFYYILEANDGLTAYQTVDYQPGDRHRDVELLIPIKSVSAVKELLKDLGEMIEVIQG